MFGENNEPQVNFDSIEAVSESKRRLQLLFALALLITALVWVVMRNRQFWLDALDLEEVTSQTTSDTINRSGPHVNPAPSRKTGSRQNPSSNVEPRGNVASEQHETLLSPLQVDVTYASGQRQTIVARNSAIHLDLKQNPQTFSALPAGPSATGTEPQTNGSGVQVRFSSGAVEIVGRPKEPAYPLPAQQANVQGSVVLQARISEEGNVQALAVISGPPMLTSAALEAVKQWRFKPHFEAGKPVPIETRITVNFTISTQ
jgi:TonB family protein